MRPLARRPLSFAPLGLLAFSLPALAALGCSGSGGASPSTGTLIAATVTRDLSPSVPTANEAALVTGNSEFSFAMYHGISNASGGSTTSNFFYSPYSVSLALAMAYAGAHGETASQIATALSFTLPESSLNPAFDKLDLAIEKAPANAGGQDGQPFAVKVADSLWGDQSVDFDPTFVNALAQSYGAGLRTVDFAQSPNAEEQAINNWVANETNNLINPLLAPNQVPSTTEFVIVNAVYFNAAWATAFQPSSTQTGPFTRADGSVVQTPLMASYAGTATGYVSGPSYQAVELPYSGNTTSMIVILPNAGAYATVEASLGESLFAEVTSSLSYNAPIDLVFPSFKIHGGSISLVSELQALGMTDAFQPSADFTSMIPAGGVYISDVVHQAFVDVDESGTEAAAATAVVAVGEVSSATQPISVTVNHAFFFFIRDIATNTILFVGRENDPTSA